MKISKAIEILSDILVYVKPGDPPDEHGAVKLGIEALKTITEYRKASLIPDALRLPGETPEK